MKIKIISRGKIQKKFTKEAIKEFEKRLTKYCKIELRPDKNADKGIKEKDYLIKISKRGKSISSERLAEQIETLRNSGRSCIAVVFDEEYPVKEADLILSISNMNIDRELMLMILYEQIYRSYRIINNAPYHK